MDLTEKLFSEKVVLSVTITILSAIMLQNDHAKTGILHFTVGENKLLARGFPGSLNVVTSAFAQATSVIKSAAPAVTSIAASAGHALKNTLTVNIAIGTKNACIGTESGQKCFAFPLCSVMIICLCSTTIISLLLRSFFQFQLRRKKVFVGSLYFSFLADILSFVFSMTCMCIVTGIVAYARLLPGAGVTTGSIFWISILSFICTAFDVTFSGTLFYLYSSGKLMT